MELREVGKAGSPQNALRFGNKHGSVKALAGDWDGDGRDQTAVYFALGVPICMGGV